jgi:sphinganine-1-phosphate aldolase
VLAYREQGNRATTRGHPNIIKPETAHPAFDKAGHLFGVEMRIAPVDPVTTQVDLDWVRATSTPTPSPWSVRPATTATARSTPSPPSARLALEHGIGLHVDGCLGGFILPFGRELGYDIPPSTSRCPG